MEFNSGFKGLMMLYTKGKTAVNKTDNVLRATLTMSRVRNFARNARIIRAILLE